MPSSEHPSLKMAVLVHADISESTLLVQRDESLAHCRINEAFTEYSNTITRFGGTVHEIRGDAMVAEFSRASNAVSATIAFQASQKQRIQNYADEISPHVRVGISLGEVVVADGTVTGAGVVLAQRVEQLAEPGGICITSAINEALPQRMPIVKTDLGECEVKGFTDPVRVYRIALEQEADVPEPSSHASHQGIFRINSGSVIAAIAGIAVAAGVVIWISPWKTLPENTPNQNQQQTDEQSVQASSESKPSEKPSIAVLPFDNLSGDPDQEYFADGITEDLTTDLSKISGLFVVARNSSFAYKGRSPDVRDVSKALGVRYVLEGSVRRVNDQIRINAQLIDATTGGHIWAERFDGTMADVFSLQDKVNENIVSALRVNLTADDRRRLDSIETKNPAAYDALLRGFERYQYFTLESNKEAREHFLEAIVLDESYARAYANVALTYGSEVNFKWTDDPKTSIRLGLQYAERAMELDDTIPQIYLTRSILYLAQRRHDAAVEAGRRTVEVHPSYADGYAALAFVMSYAGDFTGALEAIKKAKQINPQYSSIYLAVEGRILYLLGHYEDALVALEESVLRNPAFARSQLNLAATYAELGRIDDAAWAVEQALMVRPDITLEDERLNSIYRNPHDTDRYLKSLKKAGVPER